MPPSILDAHQATISVAVRDSRGNLVMEAIIETKAETILQFIRGLRGVCTFYDLLQAHVVRVLASDPRKNALLKAGTRVTASLYHGEQGIRTLEELARSCPVCEPVTMRVCMPCPADTTTLLTRVSARG